MKKITVILAFVFVSAAFFMAGSFAVDKSFKVMVFSKEKTVLFDAQEIKGVVEFNHQIKKNATIVSSSEMPFVSYKGTLITGKVVLSAADPILDAALKNKSSHKLEFIRTSAKEKKITRYVFGSAVIEKADVEKKKGKVTKAVYSFKAASMNEMSQ